MNTAKGTNKNREIERNADGETEIHVDGDRNREKQSLRRHMHGVSLMVLRCCRRNVLSRTAHGVKAEAEMPHVRA